MRCRRRILVVSVVLLVALAAGIEGQGAAEPDRSALRWEQEIGRFEAWDAQNAWPQDAVLFVGSSSIRLWETRESFPNLPVVNRGFGGCQIPDVLFYTERIVRQSPPRQ